MNDPKTIYSAILEAINTRTALVQQLGAAS
jgi:hypothetical protein